LLLGAGIAVLVVPYFREATWQAILAAVGIAIGLLFLYALIHIVVSNYLSNLNRWLGAVLAWVPAVLVFMMGGAPGQVGVLTFAGASLLLAGVRGDPGCEVMSIPGLIFKNHTHLVCILLSPIDWLEEQITTRLQRTT
jgi:hypothetical protein